MNCQSDSHTDGDLLLLDGQRPSRSHSDLKDERSSSPRSVRDSLQLQNTNDELPVDGLQPSRTQSVLPSPRSVNDNQSIIDDKPKKARGRPPKQDAKDEKGRYLCNLKWGKKYYEENREEIIAKNKVNSKINQDKYRECYYILKDLVAHYKMEIPVPIQERISKVISI